MVKPDTITIAEVLLLSNGFVNATSLATKLTKFFEFMEAQVSKQVQIEIVVSYTNKTMLHINYI